MYLSVLVFLYLRLRCGHFCGLIVILHFLSSTGSLVAVPLKTLTSLPGRVEKSRPICTADISSAGRAASRRDYSVVESSVT